MDEGIPELVWIAALCSTLGPAKAASVALRMARTARELAPDSAAHGWFGFASDYFELDKKLKAEFQRRIRQSPEIDTFRLGAPSVAMLGLIYPLVSWYPDTKPKKSKNAGPQLLNLVDELFDRTSVLPTFCCSTLIYIGFCTDKLRVAAGLKLAKFPEVEKYPETELSREIASSCRATFNVLLGQSRSAAADEFRRQFWRRTSTLQPRPKALVDE